MAASGKKPFVPEDFLEFEFVGDPQISPDAGRIAYVRTVVDARNNKYKSAILVAPTVSAATGGGSAATSIPFTSGITPDSSPRWSPDGTYLAFLSGRDAGMGDEEAKKKAGAQIWVLPTAGGEARPITAIKGGVTDFVWSPDSRLIAFTAMIKPGGPEWLDEEPDGAAGKERQEGKEGKAAKDEKDAGSKDTGDKGSGALDLEALFKKHSEDVRRITRAFYRLDGVGYLEDKRSHVFTVDVERALSGSPGSPPPVRPVQVTDGDYDHSAPCFSPDGEYIAVSACRDPNPDMQRYQDIWVFPVPVEGGGPVEDKAKKGGAKPEAKDAATADEAQDAEPEYPKRLTSKVGPFTSPSWSPDGRFIAFVGHDMEHVWYSDDRLWLVEVAPDCSPKGKARCLTKDFERSFNDQSVTDMRVAGSDTRPRWSPDGKFIFLLASDRGTTHLHMVETSTGKVRQLTTGDWVIFNWSADAGLKNFAFALARPDNPSDIYVGRLPEGSDPAKWPVAPAGLADLDVISRQPVTRTNADLLKKHPVSRPERFTFAAPGGPLVDGWTIRPVDYQEGRRYPCVLQIHGGPMAMYTGTFFFEFQLLAARGIGVIYCNPRGSQGYGQEFCAGIRDEWGVNDYADIMACVDTAIKQLGWVDPDRLGVAGGSYGGYMTSWIIGHTDRFKAACSMRAVNNCHSFYGTSDTGFQWDDIWHGKPWEKWENLIKQSPITYAGNIKTPTLIIHSEEDHRCLIEQGEQLFIALKKLGVEAEFLRYPGESHGLSRQGKPWHRIHRLKRIVEWFEKHL